MRTLQNRLKCYPPSVQAAFHHHRYIVYYQLLIDDKNWNDCDNWNNGENWNGDKSRTRYKQRQHRVLPFRSRSEFGLQSWFTKRASRSPSINTGNHCVLPIGFHDTEERTEAASSIYLSIYLSLNLRKVLAEEEYETVMMNNMINPSFSSPQIPYSILATSLLWL